MDETERWSVILGSRSSKRVCSVCHKVPQEPLCQLRSHWLFCIFELGLITDIWALEQHAIFYKLKEEKRWPLPWLTREETWLRWWRRWQSRCRRVDEWCKRKDALPIFTAVLNICSTILEALPQRKNEKTKSRMPTPQANSNPSLTRTTIGRLHRRGRHLFRWKSIQNIRIPIHRNPVEAWRCPNIRNCCVRNGCSDVF